MKKPKSYAVGYKKPPKSGQFQKGASGNPAGRPKRSKNFMTLLDRELEQELTVTEQGQKLQLSKMEIMVKRLVTSALQGDARSQKQLIDILRMTQRLQDEPTQANEEPIDESYKKIVARFMQRQFDEAQHQSSPGRNEALDE